MLSRAVLCRRKVHREVALPLAVLRQRQVHTEKKMLFGRNLGKRFGGVIALDAVDFDLRRGEVHALLGENGAGKSTLINLLVGTFSPTTGSIEVDGSNHASMSPSLSRRLGVAAVFQEFSLPPDLTVLESLFLGREKRRGVFLDRRGMRKEAELLLQQLSFDIDLDQQISRLTRAQKQMVEITKALLTNPQVLILDEPTASLTDGEAEKLFDAIERLKQSGVGIIYVSHRMAEIRNLSDRVTVLRGGRKIGTVNTADVPDDGLIEMMIGRQMEQLFPEIVSKPGKVAVEVRGLSTADGAVKDATFVARAGEVVGLAGLVGCGRSELCRAIFGLTSVQDGSIELFGDVVSRPQPHSMLERGLCYFPADRAGEGLALSRPVRENVTMSSLNLPTISRGPFLDTMQERRAILEPLQDLKLRPLSPEKAVSSFSGGNQQKAMLARGLIRNYQVYVFDEPTVGIDVGAKADVYQFIKKLVERGACVILSTSELPELINLSSRIYVMHQSAVVAELHGDAKTEAAVLSHYFGNSAEERTLQ